MFLDMQNREIATAARRITRTLNAAPTAMRIAFDADGHVVDRVVGQNVNPPRGGRWTLPARYLDENRVPTRWTYAAVTAIMADQDADR